MSNDIKIPDDPKFERTVRIQTGDMLRAWNVGDFKAAGRSLDALKNFMWAYLTDEAKEKFNNVQFKSVTIADLYTADDEEALRKYGELGRKRIKALERERNRKNRLSYYKCRETEIRYISHVIKSLDLGFRQDGVLYDEQLLQPNSGENKEEADKGK